MPESNPIASYHKRLEALKSERSTFIALWRELSDHILAHRGRFLTSDRNKGYKRNTKQYNNTPRLAARTLASGMMAGITSPARPWFRLGTTDPDLAGFKEIAEWLHDVQRIMYEVFSQSNTYNALHQVYSEVGTFGTGPMGVYEDFDNVIHCAPYTVGSYMLGVDGRGRVDTFYREYELSVGQVVKQFGIENCSQDVQNRWRQGNTESWVKIVHAIEPNDNRDEMSPLAEDMPVRSVYYEYHRHRDGKFLRKSGFENFPIMAPRWDVTAEDVYATDCPGMTALGDTKALQLGERRKFQALDKLVNPPLQGPAAFKNQWERKGANEILWVDNVEQGMKSIYDFRPDLNAIVGITQEYEQRISRTFYEDLFLMLTQGTGTDKDMTAREVAERHEEKLLMLGPVLERLHTELLDPLIERTFNILQRNGVLPPPPEELQGVELKVEYVSVLAQAQRLVNTGSIERFAGFAGEMAGLWPEARHKLKVGPALDEYANAVGVDPDMIRSDREVEALVQAERQAAQRQAALEQAQQAAEAGKTASEIDMDTEGVSDAMRRAGLA